jgi:hypothetical protein
VSNQSQPLGDAHGDWYYCFKHQKVEQRGECNLMDRMGPYPTREDAENWRDRVAARNRSWGDDE